MRPSPRIALSAVALKIAPEIESQASVLWAKHDSSEHVLNNGEQEENVFLPGASV